MMADRELTRLLEEFPGVEIERVDVLTNPSRTWNEGIRMIPALRSENESLSGVLLNEDKIRRFLEQAVRAAV